MGGMRPSGLHINKPAVFAMVALFIGCLVVYKYVWGGLTIFTFSKQETTLNIKGVDAKDLKEDISHLSKDSLPRASSQTGSKDVKGVAWTTSQLSVPPDLTDVIKATIDRKSLTQELIINGKKLSSYVEIAVLKDKVPTQSVLFLHGARFTSQNWIEINVLDNVASWGFKAVAVDLPGFGKSKDSVEASFVDSYLPALIAALQLNKPIIVSPSMSGQFSLPFLFDEPEKSMDKASGFVAVAPVGVKTYADSYSKSQIPTLIVYGTKDDSLGVPGVEFLQRLPKSFKAPMTDAGHACYLDNPTTFIKYLYSFLKNMKP